MIKPQLHDRLVNWGIYVRVVAKQDVSATGRFCETLAVRAGQGAWQTTEAKRFVDEIDGDVVERAMRLCASSTKELLKLLYVFNGKPDWICRRMKIPHWPKSIFDLRRYHAETEIERAIATVEARESKANVALPADYDERLKALDLALIHQRRNKPV